VGLAQRRHCTATPHSSMSTSSRMKQCASLGQRDDRQQYSEAAGPARCRATHSYSDRYSSTGAQSVADIAPERRLQPHTTTARINVDSRRRQGVGMPRWEHLKGPEEHH
jgi:hypothetical protein